MVEIASGPPFRFGELHVSGAKRYPDALIENLVPVRPGDVYDRDKVVLYQRRLLESGYFASVQAEIDVQPSLADAAPLRVAVIDSPKHHVESGIGYNTDVGPRFETRYSNQDVFSSAWRFRSSLNLDQKIQNLQLDLDTPPRQRVALLPASPQRRPPAARTGRGGALAGARGHSEHLPVPHRRRPDGARLRLREHRHRGGGRRGRRPAPAGRQRRIHALVRREL